jgi:hypothetical protein
VSGVYVHNVYLMVVARFCVLDMAIATSFDPTMVDVLLEPVRSEAMLSVRVMSICYSRDAVIIADKVVDPFLVSLCFATSSMLVCWI